VKNINISTPLDEIHQQIENILYILLILPNAVQIDTTDALFISFFTFWAILPLLKEILKHKLCFVSRITLFENIKCILNIIDGLFFMLLGYYYTFEISYSNVALLKHQIVQCHFV